MIFIKIQAKLDIKAEQVDRKKKTENPKTVSMEEVTPQDYH
jgi:hypothetical protein